MPTPAQVTKMLKLGFKKSQIDRIAEPPDGESNIQAILDIQILLKAPWVTPAYIELITTIVGQQNGKRHLDHYINLQIQQVEREIEHEKILLKEAETYNLFYALSRSIVSASHEDQERSPSLDHAFNYSFFDPSGAHHVDVSKSTTQEEIAYSISTPILRANTTTEAKFGESCLIPWSLSDKDDLFSGDTSGHLADSFLQDQDFFQINPTLTTPLVSTTSNDDTSYPGKLFSNTRIKRHRGALDPQTQLAQVQSKRQIR